MKIFAPNHCRLQASTLSLAPLALPSGNGDRAVTSSWPTGIAPAEVL